MSVRAWIFCSAAVLPIAGLADTPVDFSGEWVVSKPSTTDQSAPADTQTPNAHSGGGHGGHGGGMGGGGGGGSGMGGGGGMGGGHHGRHGHDTTGGEASTTAAVSGNPRLHANALIIRQSEVVFDVAANGQRMAYRFDNRNNYGAPYGGTVTLAWSAPEMVIESHPDGGGSIEEHYSLSPDEKKLTLHVREQKTGEDTVHEFTRSFVRKGDDASASPTTLP